MNHNNDSYQQKKAFYDSLLTIYGRKPCLEAMSSPGVKVFRLHLADSNKPAKIIDELIALAKKSAAEICRHDKKALSRISKNAKQDQGVAADLVLPGYRDYKDYLSKGLQKNQHFIALDSVTNPQNLGMIIRSVCASPMAGLILPARGCAKLDSLVIKASAGTLFRANILRCNELAECLEDFKNAGATTVALRANGTRSLKDFRQVNNCIYVLGNETEGLSNKVSNSCNDSLAIPMKNGVESLNVAVTAGILAFHSQFLDPL
ncbi:23S rRNA (guanosine2251-2'-O)-methyltransferase [Alteromonadaceae bacterium Bs31]|nr:23S rRNA (guanosine2251-2'-O)-methyltransferase [Alteromonadaceae bacterium Bs31]